MTEIYTESASSCTNCDGGKGCCSIGQAEREKNGLSYEDKKKAFFAAKRAKEAGAASNTEEINSQDIVTIGSRRSLRVDPAFDHKAIDNDLNVDPVSEVFKINDKVNLIESTHVKSNDPQQATALKTQPQLEQIKYTFSVNTHSEQTGVLDTYHQWKKGQQITPIDATVSSLAAQRAAEESAKLSFFAQRAQAANALESKSQEEAKASKELLRAEWERRTEEGKREEEKKKLTKAASTTIILKDEKGKIEVKSIFIPQMAQFSALKGESPELKAKNEKTNVNTPRKEDLSARSKQSQSSTSSRRSAPIRSGARANAARSVSRLRPDTFRRVRALQNNRLGRRLSRLGSNTIDPILRSEKNKAVSRKTAERIVQNRNIDRKSESLRRNTRNSLLERLTNSSETNAKRVVTRSIVNTANENLNKRNQNRDISNVQNRIRQNGITQEANRLVASNVSNQSIRMTQTLHQNRLATESAAMASREASRISQEQIQRNIQRQILDQQAMIIQQNRFAMDAARLNQILQANRNASRTAIIEPTSKTKVVDLNLSNSLQNKIQERVPVVANATKREIQVNQKPVFTPQEKLLRAAKALDILQSKLAAKTPVIDVNQTLKRVNDKLVAVKDNLILLERRKMSPELKREVRKVIFDINAYLRTLRDEAKRLPSQNISSIELQRRFIIEVNRLEDKNIKDALMNEMLKKFQAERSADSELDRVTSLTELLSKALKFRAISDFQRKLKELERKFKAEAALQAEDAPSTNSLKGSKTKQSSNKRKEGSGPKAELVTDLVEVVADGGGEA